jgi:hypothetical protein
VDSLKRRLWTDEEVAAGFPEDDALNQCAIDHFLPISDESHLMNLSICSLTNTLS